MPYITWLTLGYIIVCFYFLLMILLYTFLILVWCVSSWFFLTAANFSMPALSLKIKCNVLHVQNGDIKEASSVFWSRGITRTQENCCTVWGKDLYCLHQSGIQLMLGSVISIFSRHEYTHAQVWIYAGTRVCSVSTLPHWSFCRSSHLFVSYLYKYFI
jgi:hypothetical protein